MTTENVPNLAIPTNGREREEPPPGSIADLFREALPALDFLEGDIEFVHRLANGDCDPIQR